MKYKKVLLLISTVAISASMFVACGNKSAVKEDTNKPLVVYSNSLSDGRGDWLKEQATKAGFKIEFVEAGGGDLLSRLVAEKNNPVADVVFGLEAMSFGTIKNQNLLVEYQPKWIGQIPKESRNKSNYYQPLVEQRTLLIYNKNVYDENTAPKNWEELASKAEYKGKYAVPTSLKGATDRKTIYGILVQHLDKNGELGVSAEGWKVVKDFLNNGYKTPKGEDAKANLASGKVPISYTFSSGLPAIESKFNIKTGIICPEDGVVTTVEQVGIINKSSKDYTTAKKFVDWFGSGEVQGDWAEKFGSLPVNTVAFQKSTGRMKEISEITKIQSIDYDYVSSMLDKWFEKVELEILK